MLFKNLCLMTTVFFLLMPDAPASAQSSSAVNSAKIEILERQVKALRARAGIETVPAEQTQVLASSPNPKIIADLMAKIGTLESQVRRLNGRLEEFEYRQRQTQEEIDLLRKEMELMRQDMVQAPAALTPAATSVPESPAEGAEPKPKAGAGEVLAPIEEVTTPAIELPEGDAAAQFDYAFAFVRKNDLESGQVAFEKFIVANEGDSRIGNAKYWLGRIHLQGGRNGQAAQYLLALIEEHPNHKKRPDALVDLADVLLKLDSADDACNALAEFRRVEDTANPRLKSRADRIRANARCN